MSIGQVIKGKVILVIGGTGSFGHTIVKRLIPFKPKEIRILSRDEYKQHCMKEDFKNVSNIRYIIGDVKDIVSVEGAMKGVDIVYHAAAMKHVPECESNVHQAVLTNIIGAHNVVHCAINENVEKVISISTDKAVEPINAMGLTKALQEKMITVANLRKGKAKTIFSCVRYGNVLGSRGSIIPLFRKQILAGKPLTLTNPQMTRFLLSLNNAIGLVFEATERAKGGEIFVKKMLSVTTEDMAKAMILGLNKTDHPIKIIGPRIGEKVHEVLVSKTEMPRSIEEKDKFIILPPMKIPGTHEKYSKIGQTNWEEYSSNNVRILNAEECK